MAKKSVLKLEINCDKCKKRALKAAAGVAGVDSVAIDMEKKQLTVIGDADPVYLTTKLRKLGFSELMTVGPAKEEKKKDEKKPEDAKKDVPTVVWIPTGGTPHYDCYYYDENPITCCIS